VRLSTVLILFMMIPALFAQRKGAISTGGNVSFRTTTGQDSGASYLNVEWVMGYFVNRDIVFQLEPSVRFDFDEKKVVQSSMLLGSMSYRLADLAPDYQFKDARYRKRDMGITAGVFASLGGGLWAEGLSSVNDDQKTYTGPAITAAIETQSVLGRIAFLRIKAQLIHLYPSGPVFHSPRTIYQISVGFHVFIKV